jgi:hypothetical protein
LHDVPAKLAEVVVLLRSPHSRNALLRLVPGLESTWLDWLLNELHRAGMLRRGRRLPSPTIDVVGSGMLTSALCKAFTSAGLTAVKRVDAPAEKSAPPALTILAGPALEPDRAQIAQLAERQMTHLVVRLEAGKARVGPFVIPGETPCVRCHDLYIGAHDDAWPRLLAQLCQTTERPAPYLLAWTAATAMLQVKAFCDGGLPDTLGRILEVSLNDHSLRGFDIRPHPDCGCGAD